MNLFLKNLAAHCLLLLPAAAAFAQKTGGGIVADIKDQPIAFANIVLLAKADSTIITGVTAKEDGTFSISLPQKPCLVRLSSLGYRTLTLPADTLLHRPRLLLESTDSVLGEAVVSARRPISRLEAGAIITTVENTVLSKSGNAKDLLSRVPGLNKTSDDNIEVLGKGTPLFYINGREMRDPKELERLRSEDIKSVEVIQNPGARYDSSVGAVVRIRTVKRAGDGFGVDAIANFYQAFYPKESGQLNMRYRHKGLELFAEGNFTQWKTKSTSQTVQTIFSDHTWQQDFTQRICFDYKRVNATAGFNLDLKGESSLGMRYAYDRQLPFKATGSLNSQVFEDGAPSDVLRSEILMNHEAEPTHQLNAYYYGKFGKQELNIDADFYMQRANQSQTSDEESQTADDRKVDTDNPIKSITGAAKIHYGVPLGGGKFGVGVQASLTDRTDDYIVKNATEETAAWGVQSSSTELRQQAVAGYAEYARNIKKWNFSAGLRFEHVSFDYFANNVKQPGQCRTYDNFFPKLSLAGPVGKTQLMLSYSSTTQRPSYNHLSNNVTYANRYVMWGGNPYLRPSFTHSVSAVSVWKFLQANVTFQQVKDAVIQWTERVPGNSSAVKISNINKSFPTLSASVSASPVIKKIWHPTWTLYLMKQWFEMSMDGLGTVKSKNPIFNGSWSNSFELPKKYTVMLDMGYSSAGNYQNARLTRRDLFQLSLGLRKSWLKDQLTLTVRGYNLLNKNQWDNTIYTNLTQSRQSSISEGRMLGVTLQWRFNASHSRYRGQGADSGEIQRLSSGSNKQ